MLAEPNLSPLFLLSIVDLTVLFYNRFQRRKCTRIRIPYHCLFLSSCTDTLDEFITEMVYRHIYWYRFARNLDCIVTRSATPR